MVDAFEAVCEQLPDSAADFFREGIGQIGAQEYPQPVREVMARHYQTWCACQRLH